VQEESANDKRGQHGRRPRHHSRQRPVRVVIEEVAVYRIPQAPELGKRCRAERPDEEVEPRCLAASASKPEAQVLSQSQRVRALASSPGPIARGQGQVSGRPLKDCLKPNMLVPQSAKGRSRAASVGKRGNQLLSKTDRLHTRGPLRPSAECAT
jgi:hypothetical protein